MKFLGLSSFSEYCIYVPAHGVDGDMGYEDNLKDAMRVANAYNIENAIRIGLYPRSKAIVIVTRKIYFDIGPWTFTVKMEREYDTPSPV